jgi:hypothetical protein
MLTPSSGLKIFIHLTTLLYLALKRAVLSLFSVTARKKAVLLITACSGL